MPEKRFVCQNDIEQKAKEEKENEKKKSNQSISLPLI